MKKLTIQDRQIVEVGAMLIHRASDQTGEEVKPVDHACELVDIDANQLHGLVKYTGAPFEGEEQWVPGDLLAVSPPVVAPTPPEQPPVEAPPEAPAPEPITSEQTVNPS